MCGRYASARKRIELLEEFSVERDRVTEPLEPDYNVAPTKPVYAVLARRPRAAETAGPSPAAPADGAPQRELRVVRWGLVPSWAKDVSIGSRLINARSETLSEKPAFKRAFARRRCLLPADGYYEWQKPENASGPAGSGTAGSGTVTSGTTSSATATSGTTSSATARSATATSGTAKSGTAKSGTARSAKATSGTAGSGTAGSGTATSGTARSATAGTAKQPFYICRRDGGPLAFAGLYELWRDNALPDGDPDAWLWTTTIITTTAPDDLGRIHDRMPMVIEPGRWADWLDPANSDVGDLRALLAPATANGLTSYPVSRAVNSVRNNGPELIVPVELTGSELSALGQRPSDGGPDRLF
jgi:putative SOS response-associated peptidase YedK